MQLLPRERSGSVVECLTGDRKESNQTNKSNFFPFFCQAIIVTKVEQRNNELEGKIYIFCLKVSSRGIRKSFVLKENQN